MKRPFFLWKDLFLYFFIFIFSFIILWRNYSAFENPKTVRVDSPRGQFLYPLNQDAQYYFEGLSGGLTLQIEDGQAKIIQSKCRGGDCMRGEWLSKAGDWKACLPNRISITIEGEKREKQDKDSSLGEADETLY